MSFFSIGFDWVVAKPFLYEEYWSAVEQVYDAKYKSKSNRPRVSTDVDSTGRLNYVDNIEINDFGVHRDHILDIEKNIDVDMIDNIDKDIDEIKNEMRNDNSNFMQKYMNYNNNDTENIMNNDNNLNNVESYENESLSNLKRIESENLKKTEFENNEKVELRYQESQIIEIEEREINRRNLVALLDLSVLIVGDRCSSDKGAQKLAKIVS